MSAGKYFESWARISTGLELGLGSGLGWRLEFGVRLFWEFENNNVASGDGMFWSYGNAWSEAVSNGELVNE